MHLFDTWIDFVNLRSETYAENSRIPTMVSIIFRFLSTNLLVSIRELQFALDYSC